MFGSYNKCLNQGLVIYKNWAKLALLEYKGKAIRYSVIVPFVATLRKGQFLVFITVAFLLFLDLREALTLWGQSSYPI